MKRAEAPSWREELPLPGQAAQNPLLRGREPEGKEEKRDGKLGHSGGRSCYQGVSQKGTTFSNSSAEFQKFPQSHILPKDPKNRDILVASLSVVPFFPEKRPSCPADLPEEHGTIFQVMLKIHTLKFLRRLIIRIDGESPLKPESGFIPFFHFVIGACGPVSIQIIPGRIFSLGVFEGHRGPSVIPALVKTESHVMGIPDILFDFFTDGVRIHHIHLIRGVSDILSLGEFLRGGRIFLKNFGSRRRKKKGLLLHRRRRSLLDGRQKGKGSRRGKRLGRRDDVRSRRFSGFHLSRSVGLGVLQGGEVSGVGIQGLLKPIDHIFLLPCPMSRPGCPVGIQVVSRINSYSLYEILIRLGKAFIRIVHITALVKGLDLGLSGIVQRIVVHHFHGFRRMSRLGKRCRRRRQLRRGLWREDRLSGLRLKGLHRLRIFRNNR
jgi:hypothetical protein